MLDAELASGRLVRLFPPHELPGSWVFALHSRPGLLRDPHVVQLREFLLSSARGGTPK
ncbi:hypothetical protein JMJ55_28720 [Belnapia sp. T6]|uniref:LysR substrate-binding domain-containing protein n=1 Tax=Belnapia mucosa TaxID=2804532 RepID=A0ABS1VDF3_9PROT|nr:hypothetical protein [Belnapia mucosa]MBL6459307.1 hypothetical protein [Belnapia mucosa]